MARQPALRALALGTAAVSALAALLYLERRRRRRRALPVIDISRFLDGDSKERDAVAAEWDAVFRETGFCLITGYEQVLPAAAIERLRDAAARFFALPPDQKARSYCDGMLGFLGEGAENVGASAGNPTAKPDKVESMNIGGYQEPGAEWSADDAVSDKMPWANASYMASAPAELQQASTTYWAGATRLMQVLMELSELALDLPVGHFAKSFAKPGTLLRLAWYPPEDNDSSRAAAAEGANKQQWRYGAHTDYDGFTILHRPAESGGAQGGGLEIQTLDGAWTAIPALPNSLTINIGDLLARWTNDRWRATPHRVARPAVGSNLTGRLSIVYFTGPHPGTLVECLPSAKCQPEGEAPRYEPVTAEEHVQMKIKASTIGAPRSEGEA